VKLEKQLRLSAKPPIGVADACGLYWVPSKQRLS